MQLLFCIILLVLDLGRFWALFCRQLGSGIFFNCFVIMTSWFLVLFFVFLVEVLRQWCVCGCKIADSYIFCLFFFNSSQLQIVKSNHNHILLYKGMLSLQFHFQFRFEKRKRFDLKFADFFLSLYIIDDFFFW